MQICAFPVFPGLLTAGNLISFCYCFQVQPLFLVAHMCQRHLSLYVLCSSFESLPGQSSFRPAQSGGLVLVAHEREQLLFLPAAGRPTSRPLPELVPLVSGPTNTQLLPPVQIHNAAGVHQAPSPCKTEL